MRQLAQRQVEAIDQSETLDALDSMRSSVKSLATRAMHHYGKMSAVTAGRVVDMLEEEIRRDMSAAHCSRVDVEKRLFREFLGLIHDGIHHGNWPTILLQRPPKKD